MPNRPLVELGFRVPELLVTDVFRLEPLGPDHNVADHAAWTTSIDHIRATPGFADRSWPTEPVTLDENRAFLQGHADDFASRTGFAYAVIVPTSGELIGSVYIYPPRRDGYDVDVRSWVRADFAHLDRPLYQAVRSWLSREWTFTAIDYAKRPPG